MKKKRKELSEEEIQEIEDNVNNMSEEEVKDMLIQSMIAEAERGD